MIRTTLLACLTSSVLSQQLRINWNRNLGDEDVGGVLLRDETVFVHGAKGLHLLDAESGTIGPSLKFPKPATGSPYSITATDIHILVDNEHDMDHSLIAVGPGLVNDEDPHFYWQKHGLQVEGSPALRSSTASSFFLHTGTELRCVDATFGTTLWSTPVDVIGKVVANASLGKVYLVTKNKGIYVYEAATGKFKGRLLKDQALVFVVDDFAYVYKDKLLTKVSLATQEEVWHVDYDAVANGGTITNMQRLDSSHILITTVFGVLRMDGRSGEMEWTYKPRNPLTSLVVDEPRQLIYAVENYGPQYGSVLNRINALSGDLEWGFDLHDTIKGDVAVSWSSGDAYFVTQSEGDDIMVYSIAGEQIIQSITEPSEKANTVLTSSSELEHTAWA